MELKIVQQQEAVPYTDLPEIQERYADLIQNVHWDGTCLRIEFSVSRPILSGPEFDPANPKAKVCTSARVVLPVQTAVHLREILNQTLAGLEKQGILKMMPPSSNQKQ